MSEEQKKKLNESVTPHKTMRPNEGDRKASSTPPKYTRPQPKPKEK